MKKIVGIVGIVAILVICFGIGIGTAAWFDEDFTKKVAIKINNTGGGALTYYQIPLNITYDSDMNANFSDIRVVNDTSGTTVPHWNESGVNGAYCNIWFNATAIPAASWTNSTYYLYYGNPSASSASNGEDSFEFFDDFQGDSLDTDKWTNGGATTPSVSNSIITLSGANSKIYTKNDYAIGTAMRAKWQSVSLETNGLNHIGYKSPSFSTTAAAIGANRPSGYTDLQLMCRNSTQTDANIVANDFNWHIVGVNRYSSSSTVGYIDTAQVEITTNIITATAYSCLVTSFSIDSVMNCDWVFIRKGIAPEPAAAELGAEEDAPIYYTPGNPANLGNTTGDYWVNFTWDAGGENETDSYNISWNGSWFNGSVDNFMQRSVGECGWANISIYAFNSTNEGTLSVLDVSDEEQVTCPEGCGAATNPSPASGSVNVEPEGTKIRWSDECGDTTVYNVKFYRTEFRIQLKDYVSEGQEAKSWDPNIMFYNSHYYWQITTIREDGSTVVSPLWNFTTRGLGDDAIVDRNYSEPFENTFGTMNFSILQISDGVQAVYNNVIPAGLFYLFIFGLVLVSIWIRQANVLIPALLGIILSPLIWALVPIEYQNVAFWLLALSVGGILAAIFKSRM